MIFAAGERDLGSERLWRSRRDPRAPDGVNTSCITQPPVLAIAARRVAEQLNDSERSTFLQTKVPGLVAHHEWLYRERDPHRSGLAALIHPWECGLDTSPPWMNALRSLRPSTWLRRWRRDSPVWCDAFARTRSSFPRPNGRATTTASACSTSRGGSAVTTSTWHHERSVAHATDGCVVRCAVGRPEARSARPPARATGEPLLVTPTPRAEHRSGSRRVRTAALLIRPHLGQHELDRRPGSHGAG